MLVLSSYCSAFTSFHSLISSYDNVPGDEKELSVEEIEKSLEESDSEMTVENATPPPPPPEYGPHKKLSRGEEQYKFPTEIKLVKERKFICSLDLILELFVGCCQSPGCSNVLQVKHHFVTTTVIVNTLCQAGHKYRFCSSHEVNAMYANNMQSAAAVLLSGNNLLK